MMQVFVVHQAGHHAKCLGPFVCIVLTAFPVVESEHIE